MSLGCINTVVKTLPAREIYDISIPPVDWKSLRRSLTSVSTVSEAGVKHCLSPKTNAGITAAAVKLQCLL